MGSTGYDGRGTEICRFGKIGWLVKLVYAEGQSQKGGVLHAHTKEEPKWNRSDVLLLTSLSPYR